MNEVKIRKSGTFYNIYDDDAYIIYYLFGYNIRDKRIGFPINSIDKVIKKLNEYKINYDIVCDNISKNFKNANRYNKYKQLGLNKYNRDIYLNEIINTLQNVSEDKLKVIISYIDKVLEE